jgi:hypothetical protein
VQTELRFRAMQCPDTSFPNECPLNNSQAALSILHLPPKDPDSMAVKVPGFKQSYNYGVMLDYQ